MGVASIVPQLRLLSPKHWNSRRGAVTLSFKGRDTYLARVTSQLGCPLAQLRGDVASPGLCALNRQHRSPRRGASAKVVVAKELPFRGKLVL
jgi:hypothetical protein